MNVNFTFFDLPFLASVNGDFSIEINEDWEDYQVGDAGTQFLDGGFGYAGTWTAEGHWFGIRGLDSWEYVVGNTGTQDLGGGFGFAGSWMVEVGTRPIIGTESWNGYPQVVYGGDTGSSTSILGGGDSLWSGTWYVEPQHYAITANDGWYDYSYGTTGTQVLNSGTGWSGTWV